jgi:ABC-type Co2+ transport system permease subunit
MDSGSNLAFDAREYLVRIVKYFVEGFIVSIAAYFFPGKKNFEEVVLIGLVAAATFALLDLFAPSVGATARSGAGFGIGASLVGFPNGGMLKM